MLIAIFLIIIVILSAAVHEYAHGWMAWRLGDNTAKNEGRLTLNPLKHLDPVGSVLLPLLLTITGANFFIAWAKPVPYNPYNLRDRRYGELKVALAGPATNIILALILGIFTRFSPLAGEMKLALLSGFLLRDSAAVTTLTAGSLLGGLTLVAMMVCLVNLGLALFNLIPIPPLDGSKILAAFLPDQLHERFLQIDRYGFILLVILLMSGVLDFLGSIIFFIFRVLTGI